MLIGLGIHQAAFGCEPEQEPQLFEIDLHGAQQRGAVLHVCCFDNRLLDPDDQILDPVTHREFVGPGKLLDLVRGPDEELETQLRDHFSGIGILFHRARLWGFAVCCNPRQLTLTRCVQTPMDERQKMRARSAGRRDRRRRWFQTGTCPDCLMGKHVNRRTGELPPYGGSVLATRNPRMMYRSPGASPLR